MKNRKIGYPHVVSTLALFIVLGGAAYAAKKIDTKDIKSQAVTNKKIAKKTIKGNRVKPDGLKGKQIKESSLSQVPSAVTADAATDAEALQGNGPDAFLPATNSQQIFARIQFGETAEVVSFGGLTLTATCEENVGGNDVAGLLIATATDGATFDSSDDSKNGATAADFLDTDTPAADRVAAEDTVATGASETDRNADEMVALNAAGDRGLSIPENGIGYAHSLYGADCIVFGTVQTLGA